MDSDTFDFTPIVPIPPESLEPSMKPTPIAPIAPIVPPGGLKYPSSRVKTNPFLTPYVPESELVIPPKGLPNQGLEAINPKLRSNIPPKTQKTSGGKYWF